MSLETAWQNLRTHLEAEAESVRARLEQDAPEVAKFVSDAAANPVTAALAAAVHLPEAPELLQVVADWITKTDAALGAAKAAVPAAPPAEPAPDVPVQSPAA